MRRPTALLALVTAVLTAASCDLVLEIDVGNLDHTTGTGGQGGTGGASFCTPGEKQECYTGPGGTKGQGICKAGAQTCNAQGSAFGDCVGEQLPKAEDCTTADRDEDCDGVNTCEEKLWNRRFGDTLDQFGRTVAVNTAGEVAIGGSFLGSIDFGDFFLGDPTGNDAFVAKLDADGHPLWARKLGGQGDQFVDNIAIDDLGNIIATGSFEGTIDVGGESLTADGFDSFVVKFTTQGDLLWARAIGGIQSQIIKSIAVDAGGDIVVVGFFDGTADFGGKQIKSAGNFDAFVSKLDPAGNLLWATAFGDTAEQRATAVGIDGAGAVLVTGDFIGKIDFGAGPSQFASSKSAFLAKLDPDGVTIWAQTFVSGTSEKPTALAVDAAGSSVIAGEFSGTIDFGAGPLTSSGNEIDTFLAGFDASGACLWSHAVSPTQVRALAPTGGGKTLFCGAFFGSLDFGAGALNSAGGTDVFLSVFDGAGMLVAQRAYGDAENQEATDCAGTPTGKAILIGDFAGALDPRQRGAPERRRPRRLRGEGGSVKPRRGTARRSASQAGRSCAAAIAIGRR